MVNTWKESGVILICTVMIGLLFGQCTFDPHNEFISTRTAPEPISVSFIINDPTFDDPYYLTAPTRLIFRLKELNNAILASEITLNGIAVASEIYGNRIEFYLDPHLMSLGEHKIRMTLNVDTKSGSLANRLGAEYYVIKQTFTVIIDPTPPVFTHFEAGMENGFLNLKWSATEKTNFAYKIRRSHYGRYLADTIIQDTRINHYIEPGYVGGIIEYQVLATGVGFEKVVGSGVMEHVPGDFDIILDPEGVTRFTWSEPYINTENVYINIKGHNPVPQEILIPFSPKGSIDLIPPTLGNDIGLSFDLYRKGFHSQKFQVHLRLQAIPNIKPFKQFEIINGDKLLLATEQKLYRYNLNGIVPEDSVSYADMGLYGYLSLIVKPDGSQAYISGHAGSFISFDPMDFGSFSFHDLEAVTREYAGSSGQLSELTLGNVTNDGLISIAYRRYLYYTMLYDIVSGKAVWHSPAGNRYVPTVSADGKYLSATITPPYMEPEGHIYKRDIDQYNLIGKIKAGNYVFPQDGTELISIGDIRFYQEVNASAYNLLDLPPDTNSFFKSIRNITIPYEIGQSNMLRKIHYDPYTNYLAIGYYSKIKLMNASTMQYEKTIPGNHIEFSNNYIITSRGFIEAFK